MRKNLHYKVLASVLAIAGLYFYNAPAAWAEIEYNANYVEGDGTTPIIINNNEFKIDDTTLSLDNTANVYGNYQTTEDATGDGTNNNVTIQSSELNSVFGAHSEYADANNNNVLITGDNNSFQKVVGGSTGSGQATGNTVTINGDVTLTGSSNVSSYIAGGVGSGGSTVSDNHVIIEGGTVKGNICGGYNRQNANVESITDNDITIKDSAIVAEANLYGGFADNLYDDSAIKNNKLIINGWSGSVNSVQNFSYINFENIKWDNGGMVLNITNNTEESALANTNINVNSIAGGSNIAEGDTMTLIDGNNLGIDAKKITINPNFYAGVATEGTGSAAVNDDGSVSFTVDSLKTNSQIDLVAENRAVAAAFVNQGTDLISDSLDTLSHDGSYGVKTFAAVHGNRSKYDVNSDLKINGWSTIVGVGNAAEFADGDEFSWGVFYENGSGNYRTFNEFNNEFFRGDGSLVYNGGGIAARYENANGVYTEGSLRAGMLKSEMDNALRDGSGNYYGYDSESAYYGAHIGVGKIISLSDSSDLDVYGKFFHTYTEGDSFTVAKDKFEFDSITSDRLRIGARVTTNKANAFSTYYGLAYEYEFNGDADMRAQNLKAPTQSLQGSNYMAEVGFNYQPTPDSPWSFDLNMRGYAGEHEGASFNVQATYTF